MFGEVFSAWGARRKRLRKAIGDGRASLIEALLFAGLILPLLAAPLGRTDRFDHAGPLILLGFLAGNVFLDGRRRRMLAMGAEAGAIARGYDRLFWGFTAAMAALGLVLGALALGDAPPPPLTIDLPEAPPANARFIELEP